MANTPPNFLPCKIIIQDVHNASGALTCFMEFKLATISYYFNPMSFFNLTFQKRHFIYIHVTHSLSEQHGVRLLDSME
jgi:hypothetical protein